MSVFKFFDDFNVLRAERFTLPTLYTRACLVLGFKFIAIIRPALRLPVINHGVIINAENGRYLDPIRARQAIFTMRTWHRSQPFPSRAYRFHQRFVRW